MTITLFGSVISKKNSNKVSCIGRFPRIYKTPEFQAWHESCQWQLKVIYKDKTLTHIDELKMTFYFKDKRRHDLDNAAASVMDLFVDSEVISDDSVSVIPRLVLEYGGVDKDNPRVVINW